METKYFEIQRNMYIEILVGILILLAVFGTFIDENPENSFSTTNTIYGIALILIVVGIFIWNRKRAKKGLMIDDGCIIMPGPYDAPIFNDTGKKKIWGFTINTDRSDIYRVSTGDGATAAITILRIADISAISMRRPLKKAPGSTDYYHGGESVCITLKQPIRYFHPKIFRMKKDERLIKEIYISMKEPTRFILEVKRIMKQ